MSVGIEWGYILDEDVDEIGYCYEGPHRPEPDLHFSLQ